MNTDMTEAELRIYYHAKLENAHKMAQRYYADASLYATMRDDIREYEGKLKELDLIQLKRENVLGFFPYAEEHLASSREGVAVVKRDCGALHCSGDGNCLCAQVDIREGKEL